MNSAASVSRRLVWSSLIVLGGIIAQALSGQTILATLDTAGCFLSSELWQTLVGLLGGRILRDERGTVIAEVDFLPLLGAWLLVACLSWLLAARLVRRNTQASWSDSLATAGFACGWWWLMGLWELTRLVAVGFGWESLDQLLLATPQFWQATALAGWIVLPFTLSPSHPLTPASSPPTPNLTNFISRHATTKSVLVLIAIYVVVFTAMNWRLWHNLRIPHGDSAMYEEHLWNLWHGKGFRSYLDQGLFLGEHIQVIHLLLLPLHLLWPSHLLLELCESTALAFGAIPVFRLARRSTGSDRAALLMSAAYLLYFPLHFLDIEVDLKTFRPESFCVPFFLFAFDALEEGRLRRTLILLAIALSAKEDYSIIIAPLGVWIAATAFFRFPSPLRGEGARKRWTFVGLGMAAFGIAYLLLATRVVIPWFRDGAELHYVKYFSKFGDTMSEVVWNMLTNPRLLFGELLTARSAIYALSMLLPVGFVALLSPGRLAVGLPLFGILCLNELAADPRHHFHAPLVPVVFWATAVGVGNAGRFAKKLMSLSPLAPSGRGAGGEGQSRTAWSADSFARQFVWASAFTSGLFLSLGPTGLMFWDSHASLSLWRLYAHDPRADQFSKVFDKIPTTALVASTDFVHPRFTHHERSYDYSHYRRRVANYEDRVPDDTEFIVIDTRHPYSDIKSPDQLREMRSESNRWELLPDETDGYFIVLKRRSP
jgi:uncharacterized membrane protein